MRLLALVFSFAFCLLTQTFLFAQGLFESAGQEGADDGKEGASALVLSGYLKGSLSGGQDNNNHALVSSANAQVSLKLEVEKSALAKAFSEVRLNGGNIRDSSSIACDVREAWACVSPGPLDIKLGRQIISWGRADGINPTNTITPKDETALSSELDDTRLGNELLQVRAKMGSASIQAIWVPYFRPDVLPLSGAKIPSGITLAAPVYPNARVGHAGYALRLEYTLPLVDGSVSYFNGYPTLPGFDFSLSQSGLSLMPRAYRIHSVGADFSTTINAIGIRGETAVKYPYDDHEKYAYVPNPYAQYVAGLDKSIGNWNLLLQYSGLFVIHHRKIAVPVLLDPFDPMAQALYAYEQARASIKQMNRLFTGTADKFSHACTGNVQWNTLYETLHIRLAGMYNFTTKDYAINPSVSYDIADAITLAVGGRYIDGPEGNLNAMITNLMSFVYTELKISF